MDSVDPGTTADREGDRVVGTSAGSIRFVDLYDLYAATVPNNSDPLDRRDVIVGVVVASIEAEDKNVCAGRTKEDAIGPELQPPHVAVARAFELLDLVVQGREFPSHLSRKLLHRTLEVIKLGLTRSNSEPNASGSRGVSNAGPTALMRRLPESKMGRHSPSCPSETETVRFSRFAPLA